jgi:hypothetical protein
MQLRWTGECQGVATWKVARIPHLVGLPDSEMNFQHYSELFALRISLDDGSSHRFSQFLKTPYSAP